jgi:hypothetical protein
MRYFRQNMPVDNNQLRQKIWDLSIPILEEYGLLVEVEEKQDKKHPGEYAVYDVRIVKDIRSFKERIDKTTKQCDSEPPTMPETPVAKVANGR